LAVAVTLLYLAWVREKIGIAEEAIDALPAGIDTPALLAHWLAQRGEGYGAAFADLARLRCAVDQHMTAMNAALGSPKEIAFFPPVTGG
jgi:sulfur-carrier protein